MNETTPKDGTAAAPDPASTTPMLAHYLEVKRTHPDCLVFYRMGDFYELFFDDAVSAAGALDITLTKRGKQAGEDVPMCGVPVHSAESYLARLIKKGFRVAVCEQMEDPAEAKKRGGAKALVKRDVIRIVTPGTITEETLLDARRNNYLAALAEAQNALGLAWLDMTTGEFRVEPVEAAGLPALLARVEPGELLVSERLLQKPELYEMFGEWKTRLTPLPASRFDSENGRRRLTALFEVETLDSFGVFGRAETAAAGALVDYVELTQKGAFPVLSPPVRAAPDGMLAIDAATRRSLELTRTQMGERRGSLLSVIDKTVTGPGARQLAADLNAPLADPAAINARLDMVGFFAENAAVREAVRRALKDCPDMERALSRLSVGRGGPRDLAVIRDGLTALGALKQAFEGSEPPEGVAACLADFGEHGTLIDRLARALKEELPLQARDGGFVAQGYSEALDEQRTLSTEGRKLIAELEARYRRETGIERLKIAHNNMLGFYIEVASRHADTMPKGPEGPFIQRQSMANAVRYATVELSELEDRINKAGDKALALELALFDDLVQEALARAQPVGRAARAVARLDVVAALAQLAEERRYCRPEIVASTGFRIAAGRHPVVEASSEALEDGAFIANDCDLSDDARIWLLTGPNMAGKSTFLRQNALIVILAQMGGFVPAEAARIGVVDRLFSRVGAADDLARGRSTFMVEMVETAAILNQATEKSLVILDEIGRGTATFDGLSIAWATVEHLHEVNRCRALFATHYHELTSLAAKLDALACHTMRVKEWQDKIVFVHEVAPGTAEGSYGIHVGKLAGMPAAVVARAEEVLAMLEEGEQGGALAKLADDLPLFTAAAAKPAKGKAADRPSPLEQALAELNPDELSPKEALEALYRLKELLGEE